MDRNPQQPSSIRSQISLEPSPMSNKQATKLITAIFTLHNFLLDEESDDDIEDEDLDCQDDERNEGERNEGEIDAADQDDQDFSTRDILLRHSRWLIDD